MNKRTCELLLLTIAISLPLFGEKHKVIFDCDFGGDIDDAYALGLLLSSPEIEIVGVVVAHGNTPKRAEGVCKFLYNAGRDDIPVVVGRQTSDEYQHQYSWSEGFELKKPIEQSGADFIIEQLRANPGEIILMTVGPVTNMGDVLDKDPEVLKLAKKVYSMFGSYYVGYGPTSSVPLNEYNVRADIEASKKFTTSGADIVYAGFEVTLHVKYTEEYRKRMSLRDTPITNAIDDLYTLWRYESFAYPDPTLFDAIPIAMLIWPDLFKTRPAFIKVVGNGYTVLDESKEYNCEIGMRINLVEFLDRYTERLLKQNLSR
jgi:inosine-uridine nucleoside N-ribohydrolase